MEINFGFQLTQVAGVSVEQFKQEIDSKKEGEES